MSECTFCQIVSGKKPAKIIYRDDLVIAFHDIHPSAPVHVLVVPHKHFSSINDITPDDEALVGRLFTVAHQVAIQAGVDQSGYRLIINNGPHAGQGVYHLHLHVIGGRQLSFPIG